MSSVYNKNEKGKDDFLSPWKIYSQDKSFDTTFDWFIKFGSRVDVLLPLDFDVMVDLGQKVRGGETVIAEAHKEKKQ